MNRFLNEISNIFFKFLKYCIILIMKRITLITQFFPPYYAATGQLLEGLTNKLSKLNLKFTILCGMPHYAFKKNNVDLYEFKK